MKKKEEERKNEKEGVGARYSNLNLH